MLPILYLEIPSYALWASLGLMVSLVYTLIRSFKIDLSFIHFIMYIVVCMGTALVGARLMFAISMIPQCGFNIPTLLGYFLNGGIVFYGGLLGVLLGIIIVSKVIKQDSEKMLDFVAPAFPLFHIFGRIGCLFAGCCYGKVWPWGVILADDLDTIRFPVQFFEAACNLLIFICMTILMKKRGNNKGNLEVYFLSYSVVRFILEFYRGDVERGIWFGLLSTAQIVSIIIFVITIFHIFKARKAKTCELNVAS